jgi:hypothetical protein
MVAGRRDPGVTAGLACGNWVQLRASGVWRGQRRQLETWRTGSPDLGRAGHAAADDSTERSLRLSALHQLNPVIHARPGRCAPAVGVKVFQYAPRLATANDTLEDLDPDDHGARPPPVVAAGVGAARYNGAAASRGALCEVRRDHFGLGRRALIVVAGDRPERAEGKQ